MAKIKFKDARNLSKAEKERKLKELRLELIKSQTKQSKTGSSKSKQIKRTIARLLTIKVK
jgi:ribosomal protein L29